MQTRRLCLSLLVLDLRCEVVAQVAEVLHGVFDDKRLIRGERERHVAGQRRRLRGKRRGELWLAWGGGGESWLALAGSARRPAGPSMAAWPTLVKKFRYRSANLSVTASSILMVIRSSSCAEQARGGSHTGRRVLDNPLTLVSTESFCRSVMLPVPISPVVENFTLFSSTAMVTACRGVTERWRLGSPAAAAARKGPASGVCTGGRSTGVAEEG